MPDELDAEKMCDAVDAEMRLEAAIELKREQTALSAEFLTLAAIGQRDPASR